MNVVHLPLYEVQNALNEALDYFKGKAYDAWKLGSLHLRQGYDVSGKRLIDESIVFTRLFSSADEIERVIRARDEFFQKSADALKLSRLHRERGYDRSADTYHAEAIAAGEQALKFALAVHTLLNERKDAREESFPVSHSWLLSALGLMEGGVAPPVPSATHTEMES